jgi:hypothetical protein
MTREGEEVLAKDERREGRGRELTSSVETVVSVQSLRRVTVEENLRVDEVEEDVASDLSKVHAGNHLWKKHVNTSEGT